MVKLGLDSEAKKKKLFIYLLVIKYLYLNFVQKVEASLLYFLLISNFQQKISTYIKIKTNFETREIKFHFS